MNKNLCLENTKAFVKKSLENAEGGHDWFHIERVFNNAMHIVREEDADEFIVALAALLHDIADYKFHNGDEEVGPRIAQEFLVSQELPEEIIDHVVNIINHVSFKGGNTTQEFHSAELDIVQDADRLDALGAIGIARTFNYGGFKGRALYDPSIAPNLNMSKEEYKNSSAPTINHFYEKLLLLKDRMNTRTAKDIAELRHHFMQEYLDQFYAEWSGEK